MLAFALAYATRNPAIIMGKTCSGRISVPLLLVNLPWLIISWITLLLFTKFSREPAFDRIGSSRFYIGRYPFIQSTLAEFSLVIDLTAEFPRWHKSALSYVCVPNLDGVPLSNLRFPPLPEDGGKILIHCAQGHGRSATYASLLLASVTREESPESVMEVILRSRPAAHPNRKQREQIASASGHSASARK
jgi:hypothetical protein